jgi:hypothetical protein
MISKYIVIIKRLIKFHWVHVNPIVTCLLSLPASASKRCTQFFIYLLQHEYQMSCQLVKIQKVFLNCVRSEIYNSVGLETIKF